MKLTLTFASALFLAVLAQSLAECETSDRTQWSSDVLQKCNSQLTNGNIDPDLIACLCSNNLVPNEYFGSWLLVHAWLLIRFS